MANLPSYGWFQLCEKCGMPTSRITNLYYKRKVKTFSVCLTCRPTFVAQVRQEYTRVWITKECVAVQDIRVSGRIPT